MYKASFSSRFNRDVKTCTKKHWDMNALKTAIADIVVSDEKNLDSRYSDHALIGSLSGYRAIHVDSAPNPPKDRWVLMHKIKNGEILFVRTGTHDEVYGK